MKKTIVCICLMLAVIFVLSSCSHSLSNEQTEINRNQTYNTFFVHADYPEYETAEDIVTAATNIYSGIITDISFEIIDYKTGTADSAPTSKSTNRMLYTVYSVTVKESIKGENPSEIKICRMGGLKGYKEEQQYKLVNTSGILNKYNGIPLIDNELKLTIDSHYLFCTSRTVGDYDFVINLDQFATPINSDIAWTIRSNAKGSK